MKDEIKALNAHGVAVCRLIHSSESTADARQQTIEEVLKQVKEFTIVLASPEAVLDTHRTILRPSNNLECLGILRDFAKLLSLSVRIKQIVDVVFRRLVFVKVFKA